MLYNLKQAVDWVQMGRTGEDASDLKSIVTREGTQLIYWPACWSVLDKDLKGIFAVGPQVHRCWEWVT